MKWCTEDYKGNPRVWYSGDVIDKIKEYCLAQNLKYDTTALDILQIIEEEQ